jgi:hypothetical protein
MSAGGTVFARPCGPTYQTIIENPVYIMTPDRREAAINYFVETPNQNVVPVIKNNIKESCTKCATFY